MSSRARWKFTAAGFVGSAFVHALFATVRMERMGLERLEAARRGGGPVVFAFWHGQLLPLLHAHRDRDVVTLVSEHKDGEYVTHVLERAGYGTVRGSSTRGGARGLRGLVAAARAGHDVAITPDGPQGPPEVVKPGALAVARLTQLPIVPVAAGSSRGAHLSSWDRFLVPAPFSTVRIAYGEPITISRKADAGELADATGKLQTVIRDLCIAVGDGGARR